MTPRKFSYHIVRQRGGSRAVAAEAAWSPRKTALAWENMVTCGQIPIRGRSLHGQDANLFITIGSIKCPLNSHIVDQASQAHAPEGRASHLSYSQTNSYAQPQLQ
jgi:hypothetical protein